MTTDHIGPSSTHVRLSRRVMHHGIGHGLLCPRDLCRLGDPGGERGPGRPGTLGHFGTHPLCLAGGHACWTVVVLSVAPKPLPPHPGRHWKPTPLVSLLCGARPLPLLRSSLYRIGKCVGCVAVGNRPDASRKRIGVSAVFLVVPRCRHGKTGRGTMVRTPIVKTLLQEEDH